MKNPFVTAARAEDVENLLQHIAWSDVIRPDLDRQREMYTKLLVAATLGQPVKVPTIDGYAELSKEQLAGRISGFDYVISYFEKILTEGAKAVAELRSKGLS
jgi:hypothetical protein